MFNSLEMRRGYFALACIVLVLGVSRYVMCDTRSLNHPINDTRKSLLIGFLPALTANKGQSKHYVGAFEYALRHVNDNVLINTGYRLNYSFWDNKADALESLRGMTAQYMEGAIAFIGPEDTCTIEARLAVAWNLPMIAFVSILLVQYFCHYFECILKMTK